MKALYFECNMGAAGDMLMAALLELADDADSFLERLNGAGIPGVRVSAETSVKCGIAGTHIRVAINGHEEDTHTYGHHHNSYQDIENLVAGLSVSDAVKKHTLGVYRLIAEAESRAHNEEVNQIHFHEVGQLDAVADIVGVCMLIEELAPDIILGSPVNVGSGHVRCAHGVLPTPAPATAYILRNVPMHGDTLEGELCTPTGAALLKYFVKEFAEMPVISASKIGYGMGKKDFERVNCVRAYIGDICSAREKVAELVCNLDDMTPEALAFAMEVLFEAGALDVYTTSIGMKKGRTGVSLTCMCLTADRDKMLSLIFKHTTTLGIREYTSRRYTLQKEQAEVSTELGNVRIKTSRGFGVNKDKPEYEDIARISRETGLSMHDVLKLVKSSITTLA